MGATNKSTFGLMLCIILTSTVTIADPASSPSIVGHYECSGHDPNDNKNYLNEMIVAKFDNGYSFEWLNADGNPYNYGTGFFIPEKEIISLVFWAPHNPNYFGSMVYDVQSNGSLHGLWSIQQTSSVGTEICVNAG